MKIIRQMLLTVYEDGTTRMTERDMTERDNETGRFLPKKRKERNDTPYFPALNDYMERGHGT